MTAVQLFIGLLTLVVNAFFVGAEFALISVRRAQVEPLAQAGDKRARKVLWGLEHVAALLAAAQLGITLCTLVLGVVAEPAIAHLLEPLFHAASVPEGAIHPISFVIALAVSTYLHMLLGEMVPKNIALAGPERAALVLGPPLVALTRALRPVIFSINAVANGLLKLLRVEPKSEVEAAFSDDDLAQMVADSSEAGLLDDRSTERLRDALELGRRPVGDVAQPLEKLVTARRGVTPEGLERLSADSGYSRFPVVDDDGRVLGYLHVKDALDASPREQPFPVTAMRPIARVRAALPLDDVLGAMRSSGTHLAAVTGADGRAAGVVTMEDVLRELVGQA
ncbi:MULTISPECIES: hemolysin family protein [unclassified Streptomyces]|uniref:hemolysin family protein n=1 Tax=unclassified Streptomyces TaxID=2593676 RepID=UPI002DDBEC39|nr:MULTISPECIES: hemolysin family protein [unclassified Streptomyces]WSA96768.1 hemolysin family protein [Streptomyces sp. NBC_01795]WSB81184.1 hemolysin family protein [Streptomyces sp. NBC_01775]WSS10607.1 hemolysin family protein [Streptomyces sp. NBC_01186]WSS39301.1 hemolysin family protein [Streptomyces sp. NBC_01187]